MQERKTKKETERKRRKEKAWRRGRERLMAHFGFN